MNDASLSRSDYWISVPMANMYQDGFKWLVSGNPPGGCTTYHLLRVTAVLVTKPGDKHVCFTESDGVLLPAGPLRDPARHPLSADNFVVDSIRLANLQYLASGACFGLDTERLRYVKVDDATLYSLSSSDKAGNQYAAQFVEQERAKGGHDNPYIDRVILFYRWGANDAHSDRQGYSSPTSPFIVMPSDFQDTRTIDGKLVVGNNQLSHELGHFMGLGHPFAGRVIEIEAIASRNNPNLLPLDAANAAALGITDVAQREADARSLIARFPFTLDQDYQYAGDTDADLGPFLPLVCGLPACDGEDQSYSLTRYDRSELDDSAFDAAGNAIDWTVKPGAVGRTDNHRITEAVRRNVMSYWACDPAGQVFTGQQVVYMEKHLRESRSTLIGRTFTRTWWWEGLRWFELALPAGWKRPLHYRMPSKAIREVLPRARARDRGLIRRDLERSSQFAAARRSAWSAAEEWETRSRGGM